MAGRLTGNPLFDNAPGGPFDARLPNSIGLLSEKAQIETAKVWLNSNRSLNEARPRSDQFLPYLLLRSAVTDRGVRPFPTPRFDSPDIWVAQGDPSKNPNIPGTQGDNAVVGAPNTVYAHVWNLGRAPIAGVRVEFSVSYGFAVKEPPQGQIIGMTRIDLPPRSSLDCHKLVKCPEPWIPVLDNTCDLIVRVSCIGDTIGLDHPWNPALDRHVARRAVMLMSPIAR
jgi:hypothetical protein